MSANNAGPSSSLPPLSPRPGAYARQEDDNQRRVNPRFNLHGDTKIREDIARVRWSANAAIVKLRVTNF